MRQSLQPTAYSLQPRRRYAAAFTLIELLVVIIVIGILSSLILGGISVLREAIIEARNDHLIGQVRLGLEQAEVEFAPVVHPLAATAAYSSTDDHFGNGTAIQRAIFYRGGTALATSGEGLRVDDLDWLASDQERALMPEDLYAGYRAEGDNPTFFGLRRRMLTVVGATASWIDAYRDLPGDESQFYSGGDLQTPYDETVYDDALYLRSNVLTAGTLLEEVSRKTIERALGTVLSELSQHGAMQQSADPDDAVMLSRTETVTTQLDENSAVYTSNQTIEVDVAGPATGSYDAWHRVWFPGGGGENVAEAWEPGFLYDDGAGNWRRYYLRGTSLRDYYGADILVWRDVGGNLQVTSAGPDGCFAVGPGPNGVLDSDPGSFDGTRGSRGGDDSWAAVDNQGTQGGEQ